MRPNKKVAARIIMENHRPSLSLGHETAQSGRRPRIGPFYIIVYTRSGENLFWALLQRIVKIITMSESPTAEQNDVPKDAKEVEKLEEAKLKAKFPNAMLGRGPGGHSAFLQKRLAKGQKFFDSGDYQMAKQRPSNLAAPFKAPAAPKLPTGDAIPTPDTVPLRKTSIIQPKFQPSSQTS
nr:cAMP-regulated phosphoprotein 19 [Danaus plexippus plexippus]